MPTPEGRVKQLVKFLLDRYKPHGLWYYMPVSGGYGVHGIPDFIVCFGGQFIAIETKAPKGKPTPLQDAQLTRLAQAGALVFVIDGRTGVDPQGVTSTLTMLEVQLNLLLTKQIHNAAAPHQ